MPTQTLVLSGTSLVSFLSNLERTPRPIFCTFLSSTERGKYSTSSSCCPGCQLGGAVASAFPSPVQPGLTFQKILKDRKDSQGWCRIARPSPWAYIKQLLGGRGWDAW